MVSFGGFLWWFPLVVSFGGFLWFPFFRFAIVQMAPFGGTWIASCDRFFLCTLPQELATVAEQAIATWLSRQYPLKPSMGMLQVQKAIQATNWGSGR